MIVEDTPDDPQALEARMALGDEQALAALFSLHRERLWRIASFRLADKLRGRIDPDDVLQDAYLAAGARLEHYDGGSAFLWLRLVVNQTLVDLYRRHLGAQMRDAGREVAIQRGPYSQATSASVAIQLAGDLTSPSEAAVRAEMLDIVERAMEGMDPIDREVLALRHFEELTNGEVAEALGIQAKAASIRYVRAIRRLKLILNDVPGLADEMQNA
ncbi:sigma-70 family RNA polymerase sigma factor [bacterium]|nr:sigma-70 family RNA polymerase sigma factor [bacterium]